MKLCSDMKHRLFPKLGKGIIPLSFLSGFPALSLGDVFAAAGALGLLSSRMEGHLSEQLD